MERYTVYVYYGMEHLQISCQKPPFHVYTCILKKDEIFQCIFHSNLVYTIGELLCFTSITFLHEIFWEHFSNEIAIFAVEE